MNPHPSLQMHALSTLHTSRTQRISNTVYAFMNNEQQQQQQQQQSNTCCDTRSSEAIAAGEAGPANMERRRSTRGRASRRRRRKLRAIQAAEQAIRQGKDLNHLLNHHHHHDQGTASSCLPSDRGRIWPAVLKLRQKNNNDKKAWSGELDERALVGQLGYLPGNVIRIATRAEDVPCLIANNKDDKELLSSPVVVQLYPLVVREEYDGGKSDGRNFKSRKRKRMEAGEESKNEKNKNINSINNDKTLIEPFPTMYWLTHPTLRVLVSKLELQSFGVELEKRLASDPEAMKSMQQSHQAYGLERYNLLTDGDQTLVQERKWQGAIDGNRGVAGIRNPAAVKCLHAHAAHYLSGDRGSSSNVVGKWVMEAVERLLSR